MEAPQNMDSQTTGDARVLRVFALVYAYFIRLDPRPPSPSGLRRGCRVIRLGANDMDGRVAARALPHAHSSYWRRFHLQPSTLARCGGYADGGQIVKFGGFGNAAMLVATIYVLGLAVGPLSPETRGKPLPESI